MIADERRIRGLFLAKSASASEWKAVSAAIKTLVEEATFDATNEGLTFRAMDPSHVALVDLLWPSVAFESYQCEKPFKFSVRVEDFIKLVGRSDAKDSVEISSTEEDAISVKFTNGYKREFVIHLIETSAGSAPLPKLEFDTKAVLTKTIFERVLNDISAVSDQVTLAAEKGTLAFSGKSDMGKAAVALDKTGAELLDLEVKAESKATYNVDYLTSIVRAAGQAADTLTCEFSSRKPVYLEFRLNKQGCRLGFYLAPRVSAE